MPAVPVLSSAVRPDDNERTPFEATLRAAELLLADTVEAVSATSPAAELLGHITLYRAQLADLVAACRSRVT